jgi:hypothetical protein
MRNSKNRVKLKVNFLELIQKEVSNFNHAVALDNGDWVVKGFIDVAKNIYSISIDTKVISKIMELLIFPDLCAFAEKNKLTFKLSKEQNHYPDITFIDEDGNKYAVDIKSSYRKDDKSVNGMTLGTYTGYFRYRDTKDFITYPYNDYVGHFVLGVIYTRCVDLIDERKKYTIQQLKEIPSVVKDFTFFVQEKYKIAHDTPGSGNTKNIKGDPKIENLINGNGIFSSEGEDIFDDYWMNYLNKEMAKAADLAKPFYSSLKEYKKFKNIED